MNALFLMGIGFGAGVITTALVVYLACRWLDWFTQNEWPEQTQNF